MQILIVVGLFLSSLFTFGLVQAFQQFGTCEKPKEHFANEEAGKEQEGSLESIVSNVKRIGSYLVQPTMWTERIHMSTLSPMELARHYLQNSGGETE